MSAGRSRSWSDRMGEGGLPSTRYTTVNVLRTIGAVLGLKPPGLNDALAAPMADLSDAAQAEWIDRAQAADVLRQRQLRIPADRFAPAVATTTGRCGGRTSNWWAEAMRGQDSSTEDHLDTGAFNAPQWRGLGRGPEPTGHSGSDLRGGRDARLTAPAGDG